MTITVESVIISLNKKNYDFEWKCVRSYLPPLSYAPDNSNRPLSGKANDMDKSTTVIKIEIVSRD